MKSITACCLICLLPLFTGGCVMFDRIVNESTVTQKDNVNVLRLAYGSCNNHKWSQAFWTNIAAYFDEGPGYPDVWVLAGDIVYADTDDLAKLEAAYKLVKDSKEYKAFIKGCVTPNCIYVATLDDHDWGNNNLPGDPKDPRYQAQLKNLTPEERRNAFAEFYDEPTRTKVAGRDQIYAAYDFERDGVRTRLILLDLRSDRQEGGPDANIMGQSQWDWLEENLMDEAVDLHLIVSSTQVLREDTRKDTWGEYPKQRDKLLNLIGQSPAQGVVLLTGDIHAAEISQLPDAGRAKYGIDFPLYEITASGLNRLRCIGPLCYYNWENPYQVGFVKKKNFGEIDVFNSNDEALMLTATLRSTESPEEVLLRKNIRFDRR